MQATVPTLTALSLSHLCARYLQGRFRFELNARPSISAGTPTAPPAPPLLLPAALVWELDCIAINLAHAFLNRSE